MVGDLAWIARTRRYGSSDEQYSSESCWEAARRLCEAEIRVHVAYCILYVASRALSGSHKRRTGTYVTDALHSSLAMFLVALQEADPAVWVEANAKECSISLRRQYDMCFSGTAGVESASGELTIQCCHAAQRRLAMLNAREPDKLARVTCNFVLRVE